MPDIPPAPAQVPAAVLASSSAAAAFPASAGAQDSVTDPSATSGTPAVLDFGPSSLDLLNLQAGTKYPFFLHATLACGPSTIHLANYVTRSP